MKKLASIISGIATLVILNGCSQVHIARNPEPEIFYEIVQKIMTEKRIIVHINH